MRAWRSLTCRSIPEVEFRAQAVLARRAVNDATGRAGRILDLRRDVGLVGGVVAESLHLPVVALVGQAQVEQVARRNDGHRTGEGSGDLPAHIGPLCARRQSPSTHSEAIVDARIDGELRRERQFGALGYGLLCIGYRVDDRSGACELGI